MPTPEDMRPNPPYEGPPVPKGLNIYWPGRTVKCPLCGMLVLVEPKLTRTEALSQHIRWNHPYTGKRTM